MPAAFWRPKPSCFRPLIKELSNASLPREEGAGCSLCPDFPSLFLLFPNKILRWRRIAKICYLTGIQTRIALQPYSDLNTHQKNFVIYPQTGQYANHRQKSGVPAQKQGSGFPHFFHNTFPNQREALPDPSFQNWYVKYEYM